MLHDHPAPVECDPFDVPASDAAWWAAGGADYYADPVEDWDTFWDDAAAEAEAVDRLERAMHPDDLEAVHGDAERRGCWGGHGLD